MKLFVIEGLDGAGKSTQIRLLRDYLAGMNYSCEYLHFPRTGSPWFGELVARFLRGEFGSLNDVDPYLVAMLYAGDRRDASEIISGWLSEGKIVILDRYTYSNVAYQCAKLSNLEEQEKRDPRRGDVATQTVDRQQTQREQQPLAQVRYPEYVRERFK